jgi:hypothetical protein
MANNTSTSSKPNSPPRQTQEQYYRERMIQTGRYKELPEYIQKQKVSRQTRINNVRGRNIKVYNRLKGTRMDNPTRGRLASFITGRKAPFNTNPEGSKRYASAGRPKGSFYKYLIPGVGPVDVFTWRKWNRNQQRLLAIKMQTQNPELNYVQAIQTVRRIPTQQIQQMNQNPQQQQIMQQQVQEQQIQQQYSQPAVQQDDGWGLLRIKSPLTMTAPNTPVNPIANAQAPVGNKYTSYYSEPDFLSGKQVMKQRPNIGGFGLW